MQTSPRYAILFGIPVDRTGFDACMRGDVLPDYRRLLLGSAAELWDQRYVRIAKAAQDLIDFGTTLQASVFTSATLNDLADASRSCDVLIILAHWRGWEVSDTDIADAIGAVTDRLVDAGIEEFRDTRCLSRRDIARLLNRLIDNGTLLRRLHPTLADVASHEAIRTALARDVIDETLGAMIVPGNRVELYDGLHTPGAIDDAIAADFRGDIDLSICTSLVLASLISKRRRERVHVVHTVDPIDPLSCCVMIAEAMKVAKAQGRRYSSARLG
jgi:hypothetical protein